MSRPPILPLPADVRYNRLEQLLSLNLGRWFRSEEIRAQLGVTRHGNVDRLIRQGLVECRRVGGSSKEYRMQTPFVPKRVKPVAPAKPSPAPKPVPVRPALRTPSEAAQQREAQRRREREEQTRQMIVEDVRAVTADLEAHPDSLERDIARRTALSHGRIRRALIGVERMGRLRRDGPGTSPRYALMVLELPPVVTPRLTAHAARIEAHLAGRPAETELGLVALSGLGREAVRMALAHLHGLGRLDWSGVGYLTLYRRAAHGQQEAAD